MTKIQELKQTRVKVIDDAKALLAKADAEKRALTENEKTESDNLIAQADTFKAEIERREAIEAHDADLAKPKPRNLEVVQPTTGQDDDPPVKLPAEVRSGNPSKAFRAAKDPQLAAHRCGRWMQALYGDTGARQWCSDNGMEFRAMSEGTNSAGGFLVPDEFNAAVVNLKELYGVCRKMAQVVPMARDRILFPRRTAGNTVYYIGENPSAITQSNPTFDQVALTSKTAAQLTLMSAEVFADSAINLANFVAEEMAYAFSVAEDTAAVQGTGAAATGGINGYRNRLTGIHGTAGTSGYGLSVSTGGTWAAAVLADFHNVIGICPAYAHAGAQWMVHSAFFYQVMQRLMYAQGGTTVDQAQGGTALQFLGYPVQICQAMTGADGTVNDVTALFGNFALGSMLGDRQSVAIAVSNDRYFDTNQVAIRGIERFDFNFHSAGVASTSSGPVVGLIVA